jgi:hypothetical protein
MEKLLVIILTLILAPTQSTPAFARYAIDIPPKFYKLDDRTIPVDYYEKDSVLPKSLTILEFLMEWEWGIPYEKDAFDCSQMAVYLEWVLENNGYETKIIEGEVQLEGEVYGHMWLRILIDGEWRLYEPTWRMFVPEDFYNEYAIYAIIEDIYDLWDRYWTRQRSAKMLREYGWWYDAEGMELIAWFEEYKNELPRLLQ